MDEQRKHPLVYVQRAVIRDDFNKRYIYTTVEIAQTEKSFKGFMYDDIQAKYFNTPHTMSDEPINLISTYYNPLHDRNLVYILTIPEHDDVGILMGEHEILSQLEDMDNVSGYTFYRDEYEITQRRRVEGLDYPFIDYYLDD